jgi:hypothetical protein
MTDLLTKREELQAKMKSLKQEMTDLGKSYFESESVKVFEEFPNLQSFSWTQYTPYFNDGDECTFGVNDWFNVTYVGDEDPDYDEEDNEIYYSNWQKKPVEEFTDEEKLAYTLHNLVTFAEDETMKEMFGDHVRVIVSRDGVEIEEYDHE